MKAQIKRVQTKVQKRFWSRLRRFFSFFCIKFEDMSDGVKKPIFGFIRIFCPINWTTVRLQRTYTSRKSGAAPRAAAILLVNIFSLFSKPLELVGLVPSWGFCYAVIKVDFAIIRSKNCFLHYLFLFILLKLTCEISKDIETCVSHQESLVRPVSPILTVSFVYWNNRIFNVINSYSMVN